MNWLIKLPEAIAQYSGKISTQATQRLLQQFFVGQQMYIVFMNSKFLGTFYTWFVWSLGKREQLRLPSSQHSDMVITTQYFLELGRIKILSLLIICKGNRTALCLCLALLRYKRTGEHIYVANYFPTYARIMTNCQLITLDFGQIIMNR